MYDPGRHAFAQLETVSTDIDGPIQVGVVEPWPQGGDELHYSSNQEVRATVLAARGVALCARVAGLIH